MNDADIDLINKTFYPGWLMVSQLRSGQEVKDGEALYRRACRWVNAARESLNKAGFSTTSCEHMLYAYCALMDESVLNRDKQDDFAGGLDLHSVSEENQLILSVLDNMQRILNCRAGTLAHLPDYGLPDMTKILQGMPGTAHQLITTLSAVLLKYEPRLSRINVVMQEQIQPGELRYAIDAELKGVGLVRYGTEFMPEGRVLIRHLKQQQYLDARAAI